jgi:malate synthase
LESLHQEVGDARFAAGKYVEAARVMDEMTTGDNFADFLTLPAYEML